MSYATRGISSKLFLGLREAAIGGAIGCIALGLSDVVNAANAAAADAADESQGRGLEEIVVTAQKREESLQKVPLSVAALNTEELQRRNIANLSDLMGGQVPSLRIEPFAGNPTVLEVAIRGFIDSNGVNVTNENPVPIYVDDVYQGRQILLQPAAYGLTR